MTKETFTIDVHSSCELTYEVEAEDEEMAREIVKEEMKSFQPIFYRRKSKRKIILYHQSWGIENIQGISPLPQQPIDHGEKDYLKKVIQEQIDELKIDLQKLEEEVEE